MLVSLKWLRELVDVTLPVPELVDRLDLTGTAVESVKSAGEALDGVVVGLIVSKERHPEADKLWVTRVDVGAGEPLQIVCGAQNFEAGDKVPVALVGSTLPDGMTIKKAKLRGVESRGMNCSARELGLGDDHEGLMILDAGAPVGAAFAEFWGLSDTVLELEITPNRPDCLSVAGVAREVGAVLGVPSTVPASVPDESGEPVAGGFTVTIDDPGLCPRYAARLIRGVSIGPSPHWLAERVTASGARSINNIVDITNYVMFELGQPLHAFDAELLNRDESGVAAVGVRAAREGESLVTLDGQTRALTPDMIVITDPGGPIALAGVMGGESTEVRDETVDILLEAACFDPGSISRTSRRLGLFSEASSRFEKGVDRTACVAALDRAAALMAELAGGLVAPGVVDAYPVPLVPRVLRLRQDRLDATIGSPVPRNEAAEILGRLGCEVEVEVETLSVTVPSFRPDLEREIDLFEEVLRVWGMERVPATLPSGRGRIGGLTREQRWRDRLGATLRASGLNETMTYSFADPADSERLGGEVQGHGLPVELLNPMSGEQSVLRRSLLPGLLRSVSYNQRRGVPDVHLYEIGSTFEAVAGRKQPDEKTVVAGVLAGAWDPPGWNEPATPLGFFDGKGVIEALARDAGLANLVFGAAEVPWLQPGRRAEIVLDGHVVGWLGEVHPLVLARFEAQAPVTAFEVALDPLVERAVDVKPFSGLPRFPAVELDVALVVAETVTSDQVSRALAASGGKLLESVRLFDVYRGEGVPEASKSLAYALVYRASDRTLSAEEVDAAHSRLVRKVAAAVGAELRG
jgi:phenylalanyl-tRNA synthetase beta chain